MDGFLDLGSKVSGFWRLQRLLIWTVFVGGWLSDSFSIVEPFGHLRRALRIPGFGSRNFKVCCQELGGESLSSHGGKLPFEVDLALSPSWIKHRLLLLHLKQPVWVAVRRLQCEVGLVSASDLGFCVVTSEVPSNGSGAATVGRGLCWFPF
jgi:hypothetical protein